MTETPFGIYFLIGLGVAFWLSKREAFGFQSEKGLFSILLWVFAVTGLWPIAALNYLLHFRNVDDPSRKADHQDADPEA